MTLNGGATHAERFLAFGASGTEADELIQYTENQFRLPSVLPDFPLPDETFVGVWRNYAELTTDAGSIEPLRTKLVQLAFPVQRGMSEDLSYQAATRKGILPENPLETGAFLRRADRCRLSIHDSFAGGIAVITADEREDFETLVRVFTCRNEPREIPLSMGATMISGYNNWDRIRLLKERFFEEGGSAQEWSTEFSKVKESRHLYQDRFILLSNGAYSGVDASSLGLERANWIALSRIIRLEHEYAHYFTRRVFGSMQNNLLDEILADYAGLRCAFNSFNSEYMLHFLGLERFPEYREGGRLQNYRGTPPLSTGAYEVLRHVVRQAIKSVQDFDDDCGPSCSVPKAILCIASMTLDELAGGSGTLAQRYKTMTETSRLPALA